LRPFDTIDLAALVMAEKYIARTFVLVQRLSGQSLFRAQSVPDYTMEELVHFCGRFTHPAIEPPRQ
jgi:hypothetical protein